MTNMAKEELDIEIVSIAFEEKSFLIKKNNRLLW